MSVFDIKEIRECILDFVYPKVVKRGMWIKAYQTMFINTSNQWRVLQIYRITKNIDNSYTIVIKTESNEREDNNRWYCVYSYLYPYHGDIIKVIKY
tara:strand:- start:7615 stop:7902 length:288 start_codon:yes stop_codon:yes gene_type:complete